jgi:redox-sensitive bicupin YhaK (pirin superfamily)
MIIARPAAERGHASHGWLDTWHSFSFADYYDPEHMGYRSLRVINEDRVQPGTGFGMHGHRDMEIITYVLSGKLQHKDSMGNGSIVVPDDLQRMSAGLGVLHSEYNPSSDDPVHLLQIWIEPDVRGIKPEYEQKRFPAAEKRGRLRIVASRDGREGSLRIHQDANLHAALLDGKESVRHPLAKGRAAYVHLARGRLKANGQRLEAGDALAIEGARTVTLESGKDAEVLLFDLS